MGESHHAFLPLALSIAITLTAAYAGGENFDAARPDTLPEDWTCGVTGKGSPIWKVEPDTSALSQPNVLKQSGSGTFPWCVKPSVRIADGFVEVKFKPLAGREDQAGGVYGALKTATTTTSLAPTRSRIMFHCTTWKKAGASQSNTSTRR
jgi:hypothetical protein